MASDIKIFYDSVTGRYDIKYANGDIFRENGMTTALLMSLFTDRRARDDDELINEDDKRGWWGDLLEDNGDLIGSRLWLLNGKASEENLELAKGIISEAVKWFVDDGVWQKFEVYTEYQGEPYNKRLSFQIDSYYSNGQKTSYKFKGLWEAEMSLTIL